MLLGWTRFHWVFLGSFEPNNDLVPSWTELFCSFLLFQERFLHTRFSFRKKKFGFFLFHEARESFPSDSTLDWSVVPGFLSLSLFLPSFLSISLFSLSFSPGRVCVRVRRRRDSHVGPTVKSDPIPFKRHPSTTTTLCCCCCCCCCCCKNFADGERERETETHRQKRQKERT